MPTVESEIELIETLSKSTVVAITLNHEDMTDEEIKKTITEYEKQLKLPTTDVLKFGSEKVVKRLFEIIPEISKDA